MYIIYYAYYDAYRLYWELLEDPETEDNWLEKGTMTGNWSWRADSQIWSSIQTQHLQLTVRTDFSGANMPDTDTDRV